LLDDAVSRSTRQWWLALLLVMSGQDLLQVCSEPSASVRTTAQPDGVVQRGQHRLDAEGLAAGLFRSAMSLLYD